MCHYPLGSWNEIGKGAIQLYGHCHGSYEFNRGRQLDVGVDSNDFKPWLLDDLVENLALIEPASVDHHNAKTSYH
jgi:calcineurin-like phosphoesterase family protein